ncbi:MAG: hypothetical protein O7E56_09000 [SAR324 cluster bacterium]|nr:hypothetical protein [SAR324 cluster bacterium]
MYQFSSVTKSNHGIARHLRTVQLEHSLRELFSIYDYVGGPTPEAERAIVARVEQCLSGASQSRHLAQSQLYILLRAKDMHRYVTEDADLVPLKLQLLEHQLFQHSPEERWAACRELLLSGLDQICGVAVSGVVSNYELYKQQISLRGGRLGRLLLTVALFNFDLDEEQPPANLRLRFLKGRFPEYCWESTAEEGSLMAGDNPWAWSPANPLCRWEYLGADLLHALLRRCNGNGGNQNAGGLPRRALPRAGEQEDSAHVYCQIGRESNVTSQIDQMELFPVQPQTFLIELQRQVHRSHGAEGVRLFALLMEQLGRSTCGEFLSLAIPEIVQGAGGAAVPARKLKERGRRLWAILEALSQVELMRVTGEGGACSSRKSRLVNILGTANDRVAAAPGGDGGEAPQTVQVLLDPYFHQAPGGNLARAYRELPDVLLAASPKDHPYALGLFVYLRQAWEAEWEQGQGVLRRPAKQLFREAGFWLKDNARYRSIEALKRELGYLKELGLLGAWRLNRSAMRDALEDDYRLESPARTSVPERRLVGAGGAPPASAPGGG